VYYGYIFVIEIPVQQIHMAVDTVSGYEHWQKLELLSKAGSNQVPNNLHRILSGDYSKIPIVKVTSTFEFESEEKAEAWLNGAIENEVRRLTHNQIPVDVFRTYFVTADQIIRDIRRMRSALTVNAGLYYDRDRTAITDNDWDKMAYDLVAMQIKYHYILPFVKFFDSHFKDFDGATGFHLPYRDPEFVSIVDRAIEYLDQYKKE